MLYLLICHESGFNYDVNNRRVVTVVMEEVSLKKGTVSVLET